MVKSNLFHHLSTTRQVFRNFLEGNIVCSSSNVPIRAWKSWLWKTLMTLSIECLRWGSPVWLSLVRYSSRSSSALWASEKHILKTLLRNTGQTQQRCLKIYLENTFFLKRFKYVPILKKPYLSFSLAWSRLKDSKSQLLKGDCCKPLEWMTDHFHFQSRHFDFVINDHRRSLTGSGWCEKA